MPSAMLSRGDSAGVVYSQSRGKGSSDKFARFPEQEACGLSSSQLLQLMEGGGQGPATPPAPAGSFHSSKSGARRPLPRLPKLPALSLGAAWGSRGWTDLGPSWMGGSLLGEQVWVCPLLSWSSALLGPLPQAQAYHLSKPAPQAGSASALGLVPFPLSGGWDWEGRVWWQRQPITLDVAPGLRLRAAILLCSISHSPCGQH